MPTRCCLIGCQSKSHDRQGKKIPNGLCFYRFPAWKRHQGEQVSELTKSRRLAWVAAVRRSNITFHSIPESMRVCSLHFHSGKPAAEMYSSHPDWAPSLRLGHSEVKATATGRYERREKRKRRRMEESSQPVDETVMDDPVPQVETPAAAAAAAGREDGAGQRPRECDFCQMRRDEINRLLEENRSLKSELGQKKWDEDLLKSDADKVKYYTGLPHPDTLMDLLVSVGPFITLRSKVLSHFQMLFMTLMRLRLNLPVQHVAHLFWVDRTTISKTFSHMVDVLHARVSPSVHWPSREALRATMPLQFAEAFGKRAAVILDCFEINTQRPSEPAAPAAAQPRQKHAAARKYLVGITPGGAVSFISQGWGGGESDERITEASGILEKLCPGDVVLADRGFGVDDGVGLMCAEVKRPAVTEGRCRLAARDPESVRKIAHLRFHIGRVVGAVRNKYTMLSAKAASRTVLPCKDQDGTFLDKVVRVCFALTNMSPGVELK